MKILVHSDFDYSVAVCLGRLSVKLLFYAFKNTVMLTQRVFVSWVDTRYCVRSTIEYTNIVNNVSLLDVSYNS